MLTITPIPILRDNYCWVITCEQEQSAYVVDPGESGPVIQYLKANNLTLKALLITHSHRDHIGDIDGMLRFQNCPVFGPECAAIHQVTDILRNGESVELWDTYSADVIHTPGHLPEHICYYFKATGQLICADILFSSGCGRMFVGTPEEFHGSLTRLAQLPKETLVYCAHEYTQANLKFAKAVEPDNPDIDRKIAATEQLRAAHHPSLPSTIGNERLTNPFMRCHEASVKAAAETFAQTSLNHDPEVFAVLRRWKDQF